VGQECKGQTAGEEENLNSQSGVTALYIYKGHMVSVKGEELWVRQQGGVGPVVKTTRYQPI
jgi:hypothetical protein